MEVLKIQDEIERLGVHVAVISFSNPDRVRAYVDRYPQPFEVYSDPELIAYRAFELGRTSFADILRPGVLWRFVKILARGRLPRKPAAGDDVLQLGGDFVLDGERRLRYAHPSADPTDRPSNDELLRVLGSLSSRA